VEGEGCRYRREGVKGMEEGGKEWGMGIDGRWGGGRGGGEDGKGGGVEGNEA